MSENGGGESRRFFTIGSIQVLYAMISENDNFKSIPINCRNQEGRCLEFVLLKDRYLNLDDVKYPSKYGYNKYGRGKEGLWPNCSIDLNQIIILKLKNEDRTSDYAAIKPIELEPQFKSPDDLPEEKSFQKRWGKWDWSKGPIPYLGQMVFEWKFWPSVPDDYEEYYLEVKEWETAEVPILKEFEIGGVKFSWQYVEKKQKLPPVKEMVMGKTYYPSTEFTLKSQTAFQFVNDNYNRDIQDPSKYDFSKTYTGGLGHIEGLPTPTWILKIGTKYILIRPLKNNKNVVTYECKYWPEILPAKQISKTALNK